MQIKAVLHNPGSSETKETQSAHEWLSLLKKKKASRIV